LRGFTSVFAQQRHYALIHDAVGEKFDKFREDKKKYDLKKKKKEEVVKAMLVKESKKKK
jgi:hypothetical protein